MTLVFDASVILKWLLEDAAREPDTDRAFAVMQSVVLGDLEILQPTHWLIDVAAVAARLTPRTAVQDVEMLAAMQLPTSDDPEVMRTATLLAIETDTHLFDTLYPAVAPEHEDTLLVTADDRYRRKAAHYEELGRCATGTASCSRRIAARRCRFEKGTLMLKRQSIQILGTLSPCRSLRLKTQTKR